jgi:FKBP-type peptidyl-prolyl cis-trans isomerase
MNKSNRTILAVLLLLLVITTPLLAYGMKESNPQALTVRVIATFDQYGEITFIAKDLEGNEVSFNAGMYTDSSWPLSSIARGDYIEVVLSDHLASEIRWITPLVTAGALTADISLESESPLKSLEERFSYTYGYLLIQSFATQGLFFDGGYYTKGALDGYIDSQSEVQRGFFTMEELYDIVARYQDEVWDVGLANEHFGKAYTTIDDVKHLAKPTDITDAFSYTYGYLLALNLTSQGLSVDGNLYAQGALDYASGNPLLLSEYEMQISFLEYQQVLEAEYQEWIAEIAASNLASAEAFLEQNKANEGVVVTPSGLQYQLLTEGSGPKPTIEDTVEVNYQLQLIDGTVVDSSYDRGESAHFPLFMLTLGFQEAVLNMDIGSVVRAWVHPDLGYGPEGNEAILPNSLLIFDIELVGIDE